VDMFHLDLRMAIAVAPVKFSKPFLSLTTVITPAWNGTYYSFFRAFQKKVHEYHRLVNVSLRIPDDLLLKAQLHVAVVNMADFVLLKRHATISAAATFDEVLAVYMEHAAALDKTHKPKPVERIGHILLID
jgi:hypothetical protein